MKRYMLKLAALVMLLTALLSLTACYPTPDEIVNEPVRSMAEVDTAVAQGNYEGAYRYLLTVKDDPKAAQMLEHFVFVPHTVEDEGEVEVAYFYDENGNMIKKALVMGTHTYEYDHNGDCIKHEYVNKVSVSADYRYEYNYDSERRLISVVYTQGTDEPSVTEYTYDESAPSDKPDEPDEPASEAPTADAGRVYDDRGNLIQETNKDGRKTTYEYDENNRLLKETEVYGDGRKVCTYTFDEDGNLSLKVEQDEYGGPRDISYTWRVMYYPDGVPELVRREIDGMKAFWP